MMIKGLSMIDVALRMNFWDNNKEWVIIHLNRWILKIFLDKCLLRWPKEGEGDCHLNLLIYLVDLDNLEGEDKEGDIIFLKIYLMVLWEGGLLFHLLLWDREALEYFTLQAEAEADKDNKIMKILMMVMIVMSKPIIDKELIQQFKFKALMKL